jgi:alpha-1,6-mannosyltransferase
MSYAIDLLQQQQKSSNTITSSTTTTKTTTTTKITTTKATTTNTTQPHGMIGTYMLCITCCQFHLPYYLSRTLPNTFACILTIRTFTYWITHVSKQQQHQQKQLVNNNNTPPNQRTSNTRISYDMIGAMIDLLAATIVFRCDCLLLLVCIGVSWLITKQITIYHAVLFGTIISMSILVLTVPLDSVLWQRLVWPEGEVLYYNTILNKSSNWGISVWHWYFTSALPKALLFSYVCVCFFFHSVIL